MRFLSVVLSFIMSVSGTFAGSFISSDVGELPPLPDSPVIHAHNNPESDGTFYSTQQELISAMGMGWNSGNCMEMPNGEYGWKQPILQAELFTKIKELGVDTIRIPMSWNFFVSAAPEYTIKPERLARVRQVVDQALEAGLIVVINSHHDNKLFTPSPENAENCVNYIGKIWAQIAYEFRDYDNNLIFESMNEPIIKGSEHEWWIAPNCKDCEAKVEVIARANQAFVTAVRIAGGRNENRYLFLKGVDPVPGNTVKQFGTLPKDSAENRLLIAVQEYCPNELCLFDDMNVNEYNDYVQNLLTERFDALYNTFVKRGIHVVYCEMGITNKNNPEDRYKWHKFHVSETKKRGIACIVWDNGNTTPGGESFGIVNKRTGELFPISIPAYNGIMEGIGKTEKIIKTAEN